MSDGSLGGAGSSWIDPYSDAYSTPPPSSQYTHTHITHTHAITHTHIKWSRAGVCGRAETGDCLLNAGSCSLTLCVYLFIAYIYLLIVYFILCFIVFLYKLLFFTFFPPPFVSMCFDANSKRHLQNILFFFILVNEMHIFFVSSTHLT